MYHIFVILFLKNFLGASGPYITGARSNYPPIVDWPRKTAGKDDLSLSVKPCGKTSLSPAGVLSRFACSSPLSRGLVKILTYKGISVDVWLYGFMEVIP
jgi:hypothetical protein